MSQNYTESEIQLIEQRCSKSKGKTTHTHTHTHLNTQAEGGKNSVQHVPGEIANLPDLFKFLVAIHPDGNIYIFRMYFQMCIFFLSCLNR